MKRWLLFPLLLMLLTGCNDGSEEAYNASLQNGLDYIAAEDYIRAEVHFEQALEARPEDERAVNLLYQIQHYLQAVEYFELSQFETALEELSLVLNVEDGSAGMILNAEKLNETILEAMNTLSEESEAVLEDDVIEEVNDLEAAQAEDEDPQDDSQTENIEEVSVNQTSSEEEQSEKDLEGETEADTAADVNEEIALHYNFEDFQGYFANYEGEPYLSELIHLIIITDDSFHDIVIGWGEFASFNIMDYYIEDNALTFNYEPVSEEGGMTLEAGSQNYTIYEDSEYGNVLISQNEYWYFPMSEEQFLNTGLNPYIGELGEFYR